MQICGRRLSFGRLVEIDLVIISVPDIIGTTYIALHLRIFFIRLKELGTCYTCRSMSFLEVVLVRNSDAYQIYSNGGFICENYSIHLDGYERWSCL